MFGGITFTNAMAEFLVPQGPLCKTALKIVVNVMLAKVYVVVVLGFVALGKIVHV